MSKEQKPRQWELKSVLIEDDGPEDYYRIVVNGGYVKNDEIVPVIEYTDAVKRAVGCHKDLLEAALGVCYFYDDAKLNQMFGAADNPFSKLKKVVYESINGKGAQ